MNVYIWYFNQINYWYSIIIIVIYNVYYRKNIVIQLHINIININININKFNIFKRKNIIHKLWNSTA